MKKLAQKIRIKLLKECFFNSNQLIDANSIKEFISNELKIVIENASQYLSLGIGDFINELNNDKKSKSLAIDKLIINLTRNDEKTIVNSVQLSGKDAGYLLANNQEKYRNLEPLKLNLQNYLNKNYEVFPSKYQGEDINYINFTCEIIFDLN